MWLRGGVVFLVLAVGAYTALWFRHAGDTKAEVGRLLSDLEKKNVGAGIAYESVDVGGFPFQFVTRIKNPVFTLDYNILTAAMLPQGQPAPELPEGSQETAGFKGEVVFTTNYFTRTFSLQFSGLAEGRSDLGGRKLHWGNSREGMGGCSITVSKGADLSMLSANAFSGFKNPVKLLRNFESIDCLGDPMEIVNKDTGAMLLSSGDQVFSVSSKREDDNTIKLNATLNSIDMEMSDEWREWRNTLIHNINPGSPRIGMLPVNSHEAVGKQNIEIKLSYRGPVSLNTMKNADVELLVPTLTISNNLYTVSLPLTLHIVKKEAQFTGDISIDGKGTYAAALDDFTRRSVQQAVDAMYAGRMPEFDATFGHITSKVKPENLKETITNVIPAFGTFGTCDAELQASFKVSKDEQFQQPTGEATISQFKLLMGNYGFSATGSVMMTPPRGELSLRCHQCHETIGKLLAYAINLQRLVSLFNPNVPSIPTGDGFRAAMLGFVDGLSQPAEGEEADRIIQFSDSGNGQMVITGRPMQEVMMQAMQTFMPFMAPPPPPAPQ